MISYGTGSPLSSFSSVITWTLQRSISTWELPSISLRIRLRSSPSYPATEAKSDQDYRVLPPARMLQRVSLENLCWAETKTVEMQPWDYFHDEEKLSILFISHLLPNGGTAQGHFLCPGEARQRAAALADWLYLIAENGEKWNRKHNAYIYIMLRLLH